MLGYVKMAVQLVIAIPKVKSMFDMAIEYYQGLEAKEIADEYSNKSNRRRALMNAVKGAKTNEDRKELSILLHKHNTNQL